MLKADLAQQIVARMNSLNQRERFASRSPFAARIREMTIEEVVPVAQAAIGGTDAQFIEAMKKAGLWTA